nr:hypothetical protein [Tanacetum cinerariifolium]
MELQKQRKLTNEKEIQRTTNTLPRLGEVKQKQNGIFISQDKYVAEILRKFGLTDGKSASTPIDTEKPLLKDPDGEDVDVHTYKSMIGSLMYLTSSRPDFMFVVCACDRFQVTPKALHLHAAKRIFRYLKGKPHLGLWYLKDSPFNLVAYSNSDYAGASLDRKSTTGGCQFLGHRLISWQCKKQTVVATSSTEAEYIAAASCCAQVLWIQNQLLDYGKKVIITEDTVRQALQLDDAKSIDCLPNEEIFTELARMGSSMASVVICLATGRKFNFSKYIFDSLVRNVDSSSKFYMYPRFLLLIIRAQVGDLSSYTTKYSFPALTQKVFANMKKVGKGFSRVETPLFERMLVQQQAADDTANIAADEVIVNDVADVVTHATAEPTQPLPTPSPPQDLPSTSHILLWMIKRMHPNRGIIADLDANKNVILEEVDVAKDVKVAEDADDDETEPSELQEVIEVVTTVKLMTEVVTAATTTITVAPVAAATITAALSAAKIRKGVVIRDLEETATPSTIIHSDPKSKDKGKGIMIQEPKPLKKQTHIEQDKAYARELEAELNKNINWDDVIEQAIKNMIVYLKNMAGFKMDYFKGMSYDHTRPIFEKYFNSNVAFLEKTEEQLEEEASRALKRTSKSQEEKADKKQNLDEEVEELKKHLQIIPNDDDDVYTEATPLALKLPILNPNEFDLWKIKIEQYFLMTDYSLWEVILNGDSPIPTRVIDCVVQPVALTTAEQRLTRKNELKARGTLLMALSDKHHLKFNIHKDAKTLIEAIEKSLPAEWRTHTLIWRNKTDLEDQSLDDLFNNLKIYEAEVKSSSSTSSTTQNIAFVSSQNIDSTNESVSAVSSVSAISAKVLVYALPNVDTLSDVVIYSFFASQSNSPQLDIDDLKNLRANGTTLIEFDMSKVECYNCHRRGHFSRECKSPKDTRRNVLVETQRKEEPTNYALMAFTSSNYDNEVASCSKACTKAYATLQSHYDKLINDLRKSQFDVISYKTGLESVEARILVYQQNKTVFEEDIKLLKLDVQLRDNDIVELRKKFVKAEQERDNLKLKLEKFQTSSKNLSQLLASQTNDKTGLGYDNKVFNNSMFDYDEMFSSASDVSMPASLVYARYKSGEGYHAVPPPYTGTFMPSKPDLVFHDAPTVNETLPTAFNVELSPTKSAKDLSQSNRPSAPIIEDWVSDSEDKYEDIPKPKGHGNSRNKKACFVCKSLTYLIKDCDYYEKKMVQTHTRNHAQRGHPQHYARMSHPNPHRHVVPTSVLTRSKLVLLIAAKPVTTTVPHNNMIRPRLANTVGTKPYSPPRRTINHRPSPPASNFPLKVTTAKAPHVDAVKGV